MAVRFDAAADRLLRTTDLPDYNGTYTLMFWFLWLSDLGLSGIASLNANSASDGDILRVTAGDLLSIRCAVGGAQTTTNGSTLTTGTWAHVAVVRESVSSCKVYLNGTLDITNTRNITGRTAATRMEFGAEFSGNTNRNDCRVMAIKSWSAALTEAEVKSEANLVVSTALGLASLGRLSV
jgi:hypothetical protein